MCYGNIDLNKRSDAPIAWYRLKGRRKMKYTELKKGDVIALQSSEITEEICFYDETGVVESIKRPLRSHYRVKAVNDLYIVVNAIDTEYKTEKLRDGRTYTRPRQVVRRKDGFIMINKARGFKLPMLKVTARKGSRDIADDKGVTEEITI